MEHKALLIAMFFCAFILCGLELHSLLASRNGTLVASLRRVLRLQPMEPLDHALIAAMEQEALSANTTAAWTRLQPRRLPSSSTAAGRAATANVLAAATAPMRQNGPLCGGVVWAPASEVIYTASEEGRLEATANGGIADSGKCPWAREGGAEAVNHLYGKGDEGYSLGARMPGPVHCSEGGAYCVCCRLRARSFLTGRSSWP